MRIMPFKDMFDNCVFECNFSDQYTIEQQLSATFNGDSYIGNVAGQKFNRALVLDGTGDYVSFGHAENTNFDVNDFSVEVIFKSSATSTIMVLCGKRSDFVAVGWNVLFSLGGYFRVEIDDGDEEVVLGGGGNEFVDGEWHHAIVTFDRDGNGVVYIDGVQEGSSDISSTASSINNTDFFVVGAESDGGSPFNGEISVVRLWDRVLSADEATQLAASSGFGSGTSLFGYLQRGLLSYYPLGNIQGTSVPDIVGSNDGTATSMSEANIVPGYNEYRNALDFDGSSDYITVTGFTQLGSASSFSVSLWVKDGESTRRGLVDMLASNNGWLIQKDHNSSLIDFFMDGGTNDNFQSTKSFFDNVWHHCVCTYDGTTKTIYIDGKFDSSEARSTAAFDGITTLTIGKAVTTGDVYPGLLQDVMIFNRELTQLEVELLYKHQLRGLKI